MVVVKNMIYLGDWDNIKRNYIFKGVLGIVHCAFCFDLSFFLICK
jgi:hypothetical protein